MKKLKNNLKAVNKELNALAKKTENLVKTLEKIDKPKAVPPKPIKKTALKKSDKKTAFDIAMGIIRRSRKGVSVNQLKEKTGYDAKKIANLVYKGTQKKLIKSIRKGVYVKV